LPLRVPSFHGTAGKARSHRFDFLSYRTVLRCLKLLFNYVAPDTETRLMQALQAGFFVLPIALRVCSARWPEISLVMILTVLILPYYICMNLFENSDILCVVRRRCFL